jgi:trehalose/maltose hydrolase-like predicted phosphorylase
MMKLTNGFIAAKLRSGDQRRWNFAQYDGYFELKELDWDYYRSKYGNIYRLWTVS